MGRNCQVNNFMDALDQQFNDLKNVAITENGAKCYKTTDDPLVDMHYQIGDLRKTSSGIIEKMWIPIYEANKDIALKYLFYIRDVREGLGERRVFKLIWYWLAMNHPTDVLYMIELIPEYGRWDDILVLFNTPLEPVAMLTIAKQLREDIRIVSESTKLGEKPISLLGKWLPSINAHDPLKRSIAKSIVKNLGVSYKDYRLICSRLRTYIDVVERKMSGNHWDIIEYPTVPSKAMLMYSKAFERHDQERFRSYLNSVSEGKSKINASVINPHEIVKKYREEICINNDILQLRDCTNSDNLINQTLEELWKALPNTIGEDHSNILMIRDGSLSMVSNKVAGSKDTCALDVSTALAIYFAERNHGIFHNRFITFSSNPQIVNLDGCNSLFDKLKMCYQLQDYTNTNIELVFELILHTAITHTMKQEDIPSVLVIVSDMEFDNAVRDNSTINKRNRIFSRYVLDDGSELGFDPRLFESISEKYESHGYKLPKLVFWNVCNRSGAIPMKENELGCVLMSGFSVNAMSMVMNNALNPRDAIMYELNKDRYKPIEAMHINVSIEEFITVHFPLSEVEIERGKLAFDKFVSKNGLQMFDDVEDQDQQDSVLNRKGGK